MTITRLSPSVFGTYLHKINGKKSAMDVLSQINDKNFDCLQCIHLISQSGDNIGVHQFLVKKLSTYKYSELEFFIPQLIQVLLSFETESMAIHDLILDLSRKYPHFCLLSFWNLQAFVFELKGQPESYSFHTVRDFINSLQDIMFNHSQAQERRSQFQENLQPALMLGAALAASFALPSLNDYVKPIVLSQSRQKKSFLFKLANFQASLTENNTMKNKGQNSHSVRTSIEDTSGTQSPTFNSKRYSESNLESRKKSGESSISIADNEFEYVEYDSDYTESGSTTKKVPHKKRVNKLDRTGHGSLRSMTLTKQIKSSTEDRLTSLSLPDLASEIQHDIRSELILASLSWQSLTALDTSQELTKHTSLNDAETLKTNYFKKETEFMIVLQNISSALSQVPREARLTSLRAELTIINNTMLPSQIDIPQLFPTSSLRNKKFHRILKLNVSEACVLNSAERVPYLLLIEYLSEDMDFDPNTYKNKDILSKWNSSLASPDLKSEDSPSNREAPMEEETDLADFSAISLSYQMRSLNINKGEQNLSGIARIRSPSETNQDSEQTNISLTKSNPPLKTKDLSSQIRIAAVMLKQLEKYGQANSQQSAAIRSRIVKSMEELQDQFETIDYEKLKEISGDPTEQDAGERKLENDFKIGEDWATKKERIRKTSIYGHMPHWDLCSVIVKNGDDLQQEAFACQLISLISNYWRHDHVGAWTKDMKIVVTSSSSGLVETINNALSVHSIKKTMTEFNFKNNSNETGAMASIKDYFLKVYGSEGTPRYKRAQDNFARSLAAYSIICYVLQIKDRHNGNIMLDNEGHIMHIDFGFILSNSPGSVGFEAAPFKLTSEYVDVLGGVTSHYYKLFMTTCQECFISLRKRCDQLVNLVDLMQKDSTLPCFKSGVHTSALLKQRLQLELSEEDSRIFVDNNLIGKSLGSMYTRLYDQFQLLTQGIYA